MVIPRKQFEITHISNERKKEKNKTKTNKHGKLMTAFPDKK
jgi:hypothetical protein